MPPPANADNATMRPPGHAAKATTINVARPCADKRPQNNLEPRMSSSFTVPPSLLLRPTAVKPGRRVPLGVTLLFGSQSIGIWVLSRNRNWTNNAQYSDLTQGVPRFRAINARHTSVIITFLRWLVP